MSVAGVAASLNRPETRPCHAATVRITHWLVVFSVAGLLVSGIGILISHPRLYWGETGYAGADSLIDIPVPFVIGPSVWNRPIHFFFAWTLTLAGLAYVIHGFLTRHFRKDLTPARTDLSWASVRGAFHGRSSGTNSPGNYNVLQRFTYLAVVFALFPAILWTGLAMSFGVTSVFPFMAVALGGHQSARTLHFVFAALLLLFLAIHIVMISMDGFVGNLRAMITGHGARRRNSS